jgi:ABC-type multidrug transport system ATPase subunit
METLLHLAQEGRTVIATIHQPRSDIFELFDLVILLSKGDVVYFGHAKRMIEYFGSLKYECPLLANPADYFGTGGLK